MKKLLGLLVLLVIPSLGQVRSTRADQIGYADKSPGAAETKPPEAQTPGPVSPSPGLVQRGSTTAVDRDDQLRLTLNPEQFGAAGNGSGENGDDCAAINRAIQNAALGSGMNTPKVLHLNGRNYRCTTANYQVLMPRDFGDYSRTSAGAGAQFSLNIVNGSIQSCEVSGGSGYNPNGWVIGQIKDATYRGSGGSVYAVTDKNGIPVPSSCVVDSGGVNYPPTGVDVYSFAQGSDGAAVLGTLSNGAFTSAEAVSNGTGMPNGNGYQSFAFGLPTGLVCKTKPQFAGTVGTSGLSTSALAKVVVTAPGSGCVYNGNILAKVPIWVGESTHRGTAQATNIAPSPALTIGCAIQLRAGVSIEGDGGTIQTDWQTGIYGANQIVALCDAYGNQAENISIRNVHLSAPAGIWLSGSTNNFVVENIIERYATPKIQAPKTYIPGSGGGLFFYAAQTGPGTVIDNISNYASGGIVVGGQYTGRGEFGQGSIGGINVSNNGTIYTYQFGGAADGLVINNFRQYQQNGNNYNPGLDQFFEKFVWHADFTPSATAAASNGQGVCPTTLLPDIRSIDYQFGMNNTTRFECYRGISDRAITILSRSPYVSQNVTITNVWQEKSYRSPIIASVTNSRFSMVNMAALGTAYKDPYIAPGTKAIAVIESPTGLPTGPVNHFEGIANADVAHSYFTTTLLGTSFSENRTASSSWAMVSGMPSGGRMITVQNTFSTAGSMKFKHDLGTPNPISNCYSTNGTSVPAVTLIPGDLNNVAVTSASAATVVCIFQFAPAPGGY
ncbi:MAG: hypothetical protein JWM43_901 [Acidobacteriaceae bacterium]|nr:hypothetical protein [Acidobacteriaceae bacterium]